MRFIKKALILISTMMMCFVTACGSSNVNEEKNALIGKWSQKYYIILGEKTEYSTLQLEFYEDNTAVATSKGSGDTVEFTWDIDEELMNERSQEDIDEGLIFYTFDGYIIEAVDWDIEGGFIGDGMLYVPFASDLYHVFEKEEN